MQSKGKKRGKQLLSMPKLKHLKPDTRWRVIKLFRALNRSRKSASIQPWSSMVFGKPRRLLSFPPPPPSRAVGITKLMFSSSAASNELAQCSTNKVVIPQPSPVKISTRTHKMKANVKSSYSSDYKTEKGSKRIIPSQPAQMGVSKSIPLEKTVPAELPTVHSPIKTSAVKSQYSAQSYVPAKTERPKTANGSRPTTPVWKPNSKTSPVVEKSKEIKGKTADARKSVSAAKAHNYIAVAVYVRRCAFVLHLTPLLIYHSY